MFGCLSQSAILHFLNLATSNLPFPLSSRFFLIAETNTSAAARKINKNIRTILLHLLPERPQRRQLLALCLAYEGKPPPDQHEVDEVEDELHDVQQAPQDTLENREEDRQDDENDDGGDAADKDQ